MSDVRPPTHNELRWAMRKINQLIKQVDILEEKVAQLESGNAVGENTTNDVVEQISEVETDLQIEISESGEQQPKKRGRKKTTTEA